jgi:hypothetical protein
VGRHVVGVGWFLIRLRRRGRNLIVQIIRVLLEMNVSLTFWSHTVVEFSSACEEHHHPSLLDSKRLFSIAREFDKVKSRYGRGHDLLCAAENEVLLGFAAAVGPSDSRKLYFVAPTLDISHSNPRTLLIDSNVYIIPQPPRALTEFSCYHLTAIHANQVPL